MAWELLDMETFAKKNPVVVHLPSAAERKNLKPGDFAHLVFTHEGDPMTGEQLWVETSRILGEGKYEGVLAEPPSYVPRLKYGQIGRFTWRHISDIRPGEIIGHPEPWNYTMNGPLEEAFEFWRPRGPAPEIVIEESDPFYHFAPDEIRQRSRSRGASRPEPRKEEGPERSTFRPGFRRLPPRGENPRGDEPRY
jgi:hypothetical protein